MFKFAITVSLMLIAMLFAACGGDTPEPAGQDAEEVGTEARAAAGSGTSTQTGEARQPTPAPRATERAPSTSGQGSSASPAGAPSEAAPTPRAAGPTAAVPASGSLPTAAPVSQAETQPSEPGGSDSLVPADPRFTDEVLLQDIYAKIDLDQFALDPEEPIEWRGRSSIMEHPLVHEHPFLHLFPSVQEYIGEQERPSYLTYNPTDHIRIENPGPGGDFGFQPYHELGGFTDISAGRNGIINFIYHPWFHPVQPDWLKGAPYGDSRSRSIQRVHGAITPGRFWFGENSTKGVLLETVAGLVEEARLPGVEPAQRAWWKEDAVGKDRQVAQSLEFRDWTLEEFLSISVNSTNPTKGPGDREEEYGGIAEHITPRVEWEILHPQLPIVRVTVRSEHALPLTPAGVDQVGKNARNQQSRYSVSFVMSFQNRWTSFEDPNRWIIRFREDLELYEAPPWRLDESLPYPNYWDDTDYMQHRIIGPVVMTVHESDNDDPILQPGNYSTAPRTAEWAAPGHVMTDRQVPVEKRKNLFGNPHMFHIFHERPEDPGFRQWPMLPVTNAKITVTNVGFPLPGHVLITPQSGPGSVAWREKDMDGNDW